MIDFSPEFRPGFDPDEGGGESSGEPNKNHSEADRPSEEDIVRSVEGSLGDREEFEIPEEHLAGIKDFLISFNVDGAASISDEEINTLWRKMHRNPSEVKDFIYFLMDRNSHMHLVQYPRPLRASFIFDYLRDIPEPAGPDEPEPANSFSARDWVLEKMTYPNLAKLGFGEATLRAGATGDHAGRTRRAESTRLLGWLAGQRFLAPELPKRINDYRSEHDQYEEPFKLTDLAVVIINGILDHREMLQARTPSFSYRYIMEIEAKEELEEYLLALNGMYNAISKIIMGDPKQK